jgi:hypothetical protein
MEQGNPVPKLVASSAEEYFREVVTDALAHRRSRVQPTTEFYLVHLLARFLERGELFPEAEAEGGAAKAEPLALVLLRALNEERQRRFEGLKRVGDTSLFVSGFFADSIARSPVGAGYYAALGGRAYGTLAAARGPAGVAETFAELGERFEEFADLLAEIAEMQDLRSNRGLLRLYERFLHTGSARVAQMLRDRGVALFAGAGSKVVRN